MSIVAKFNYGMVVRTAQRLIKRFGGLINIVVTNITPATEGWKPGTAGEPTIIETDGVFLNYEEKFIDGTVIKRGDQKVLFSAQDIAFPPEVSGTITRGTEKWNIKSIKPLNPGGTVIIYSAQVRQ